MASWAEQKLWGALPRQNTEALQRMSLETRQRLTERLARFLPPERLLADPERLLAYSYDATGERHLPDLVVVPDTVAEAMKIIEMAERHHVIVSGRGSGSNLSGGTMPVAGGVVLSFTRMKSIVETDRANRRVMGEPGVVNAELQNALRAVGFFYAPDPSSHRISTLGGNVAENSGGPHCVKYGVTTNHVLALEVIMADGRLRSTPMVGTPNNGLDWTGLVVGSEGTLAMVVGITATITPLPIATRTMLAVFSSLNDAVRCVAAIVASKIVPATLELLDRASLEIIEPFVHAGYPVGAEAVLLMEVDGDEVTLEHDVGTIRRVANQIGAVEFRLAQSQNEAEALWKGRRAHYGAAARLAPHLWVQDVTVPRPLLPAMMQDVLAIGERYGFQIMTAAHVGDGNLHPVISYDPANSDQVARMRQADHEILEACVRYGGSITGEHGIGIDKVDHLPLMYSSDELELMQGIKAVFDPERRLNPLKAILAPQETSHDPSPSSYDLKPGMRPDTIAQGQEIVRAAYHQRQLLTIRGHGRRAPMWTHPTAAFTVDLSNWNRIVDFDKENLTIEVEAGCIAGEVAGLLESEGLQLPGIHRGQRDTIGGLVAANVKSLASPQSWRDWVLGVEWIDGRGRRLRFGRKTMKNVAGYDIPKLAPGSAGRLGILATLILRLRPVPVPPWGAVASHETPTDLLRYGQSVLQQPWRPETMIVARDEVGAWSLRMAGVTDAAKIGAERLATAHRVSLDFLPDPIRAVNSWESTRDQWWDTAARQRMYANGYVSPSALERVVKACETNGGPMVLFLYSGSYEIYGTTDHSLPGLMNRVEGAYQWRFRDPDWEDIEARTIELFDPRGLFNSDKEVGRGL